MRKTRRFPTIPERIQGLEKLAYNLKWSWDYRARQLFKRLDPQAWKNNQHNPVKLLKEIPVERLIAASNDPDFLREYEVTMRGLDQANGLADKWFARQFPELAKQPIAYLAAELGLHTALPGQSGQEERLAREHCKEARHLGIPLVAAGFV